jgi:dTDP-4-amino-4,6-dideoxygalactose transaminase
MKVPLLDLSAQNGPMRDELLAAIANVVDSGRFILGPDVERFEHALRETTGAKHVIGVSSGTDALLVALMALGIGPGDKVVTTPFSFFATAGAISRLGARPVFADIEDATFNLDPDAAAAACDSSTRAVITVHLFGRPATLPNVSIPVIEDAAQSIGARKPQGVAGCLSFFPSKNLGGFGDGGAVYSNDDAFADRVTLLRTHGGRPKYYHKVIGGNFRLDALQAAVLNVKLARLAEWTAARRRNAGRYRDLFGAAKLPAEVRLPTDTPEHIYNQFTLRVPQRDQLREHLTKAGVSTEIYYPVPFHLQPCFADLGYAQGAFPKSELAAKEAVSIPIYPELTIEQQRYVVEQIEAFYSGTR